MSGVHSYRGAQVVCLIAIALVFSNCATRPKTYTAPDARRLTTAIDKAAATEARARAHIESAQKKADELSVTSASVLAQVKELKALVPPELLPKVEALEQNANLQLVQEGEIETHLAGARSEHGTLTKELVESKAAKLEYTFKAETLATVATKSDKARYDAQSQLIQQKIFKWVFRIGGGLIVILVIVLFVAGKLSIAGIRAWLHI